jgi:hypothetical protein
LECRKSNICSLYSSCLSRRYTQTRADFDEILLRHAEKVGVKVFEETRAFSIKFVNDNPKGRPLAVKWQNVIDRNVSGTISFEYLVDATGREGIMAQKYLKHRKVNTSLRNVACWGYWKGAGVYGVGTSRENAPWFEAHTGMFFSVTCVDLINNIYIEFPQKNLVGTGSFLCTTGRPP